MEDQFRLMDSGLNSGVILATISSRRCLSDFAYFVSRLFVICDFSVVFVFVLNCKCNDFVAVTLEYFVTGLFRVEFWI